MPASDAFSFYHACTGNSLTIGNVLVTWDATYRTGLRVNNCRLRNFQRAASTGHAHSTLSETGFENQYVSVTNVVTATRKNAQEVGRGLSLFFPSSLPVRALCQQRASRGLFCFPLKMARLRFKCPKKYSHLLSSLVTSNKDAVFTSIGTQCVWLLHSGGRSVLA